MSDRLVEIEKLLKELAVVYLYNKNLNINVDSIYHKLTIYDFSDKELRDVNIRENFDYWVDRFYDKPNLLVYLDQRQNKFLQFRKYKTGHNSPYKLYLSFPKNKMYECVNKVFDFIEENDMETYSKVAEKTRSDSVVLRMMDKDDAVKVINFVNNDPVLSGNAKKTNPFLIRCGVVGMAYDDMLSFNETVATLMGMYFESCRERKFLNEDYVSLDDFRKFVDKFYEDTFSNCSNLHDFDISTIRENNRFDSKGFKFVNYEEVVRFLRRSLSDDIEINSYVNFVEGCRDSKNSKEKCDYYESIINEQNVKYAGEHRSPNMDVKGILDDYITFAKGKYGEDKVIYYLNSYLSGNINSITRENDFRRIFKSKVSRDDILSITGDNLDIYIASVCSKGEIGSNFDLFYNACNATFEKYGYKQLYYAIIAGLSGEFKHFTNGPQMYRKNMIERFSAQDIRNFCVKFILNSGYDASDNEEIANAFCEIISGANKSMKKRNSQR